MLQGLDDGEIGIGEVGVLPNHGNVDFFCEFIETMSHRSPFIEKTCFVTIDIENVAESLFFKHQWDMVDVRNIMCGKHSLWANMAECREFLTSFLVQWFA